MGTNGAKRRRNERWPEALKREIVEVTLLDAPQKERSSRPCCDVACHPADGMAARHSSAVPGPTAARAGHSTHPFPCCGRRNLERRPTSPFAIPAKCLAQACSSRALARRHADHVIRVIARTCFLSSLLRTLLAGDNGIGSCLKVMPRGHLYPARLLRQCATSSSAETSAPSVRMTTA